MKSLRVNISYPSKPNKSIVPRRIELMLTIIKLISVEMYDVNESSARDLGVVQ